MGKVFKPYAGITPERMEEIRRLVDFCVEAAGGQRADESKIDAMARLFGLASGAELLQQLKDRGGCDVRHGDAWPS
jgi:hypothetical protein